MRLIQRRTSFRSWASVPLWLMAAGCVLLAAGLTPLHWLDVSTPRLVEVAVFTPFGAPSAFLALLVAVVLLLVEPARRRAATALAAVSAVLLSIHLSWLAPLYVGSRPTTTGASLVFLSQNFEYGNLAELAQVVKREHVDVLVLTDIGKERAQAISATNIGKLLPHCVGVRADQTTSSAIFSRYPIQLIQSGPHSSHADLTRLRTSSLGEIDVVAVHPQPPYTGRWRSDYRALTSYLREAVPAPALRPTLIMGDFNATTDNVPFRRLLGLGFSDALTQSRDGFQPTWPDASARRYFGIPVPRLITIDHILVSGQLAAERVALVHVLGSDHSGVLAHVARQVR